MTDYAFGDANEEEACSTFSVFLMFRAQIELLRRNASTDGGSVFSLMHSAALCLMGGEGEVGHVSKQRGPNKARLTTSLFPFKACESGRRCSFLRRHTRRSASVYDFSRGGGYHALVGKLVTEASACLLITFGRPDEESSENRRNVLILADVNRAVSLCEGTPYKHRLLG